MLRELYVHHIFHIRHLYVIIYQNNTRGENMDFIKMHGCGNDYIYFYNEINANLPSLSVKLSNRNTGIGGDGLVLILPSQKADAMMRMFNADGSESGMCGNAIRCVGKFLYESGRVNSNKITIETLSGIKELSLHINNNIVESATVNMGMYIIDPLQIPVDLPGDRIIARSVSIGGVDYSITCCSMGNPHSVVFCPDVEQIKLNRIGPMFEKNPIFPQGVNAEFVQIIQRNHIKMRVWERGTGETLACGTGACASAVASMLNGYCDKDKNILVDLMGGRLEICVTNKAVYMTGPCVKVFEGRVDL